MQRNRTKEITAVILIAVAVGAYQAAGPADASAAPAKQVETDSPTVAREVLAPVVEYTLRNGTNRPIAGSTAKAVGLGEETIPATQIVLAQEDENLVHFFGVSARDTNDLFIARIDRKTRTGKVWLTSPSGKIRGTILTSTNGVPEISSTNNFFSEFRQEVAIFIQFLTPPPWEGAQHPLNVAAKFGEASDVAKILERDAKALNGQDEEGMTPLAGAVVQAHVETVRFLLEKGADPNIPNKNGLTPLEHACSRERNVAMELVPLLLARGAELNPTNTGESALTPLSWAISTDNTDLVKLLLDRGADAKTKSYVGRTCLHSAADRGDKEICELLIAHGADVNAKITGGTTPLHNAAWGGHDEVAKLLISKGAEVDAKLDSGVTPLFHAAGPGADHKGKACVETLIAKGANINVTDDQGITLLHTAAFYGNKDVVELLLARDEAVNIKDKRGNTPLGIAI